MKALAGALAAWLAATTAQAAPEAPSPPPSPSPEWQRTLRASQCDLDALSETIDIVRSSDAAGARLPLEAVRLAGGRCPRFVVALAQPHEIRRFCAAPESLTAVQGARELRRRMALLDQDELLRTSATGRACRAAYEHELKTTRVVLRPKARGTP